MGDRPGTGALVIADLDADHRRVGEMQQVISPEYGEEHVADAKARLDTVIEDAVDAGGVVEERQSPVLAPRLVAVRRVNILVRGDDRSG